MLQDYLNANLIYITDDGDFRKLKKTSDDIVKKILKTKAKIAAYTRLALDPDVPADNVDILEVKDLIVRNWNTFTANTKDTPLTYIRGVMLEALNSIAEDTNNAAVIWLAGRNVVRYYKLSGEEKRIILEFLLKCGKKINEQAGRAWALPENGANAAGGNLELKEVKTYLVNSDSLQKYLEDASGPSNEQGKNNYESPNQHWPNAGNSWSHQFAPRAAKGIKAVMDISLKAIAEVTNENRSSMQKVLNNILDKTQQEVNATTTSLQLRSELLWWKAACYSNSFNDSYRNLTKGVAELALIKDYSALIPVIYPNSVDYFLIEVHRSLNTKWDSSQKVKDLVELLKNNSAELQKILSEVDAATGRVSLLHYISGVIWGKYTLEQAEDLLGFTADAKLEITDALIWLFHDFQIEKAINFK